MGGDLISGVAFWRFRMQSTFETNGMPMNTAPISDQNKQAFGNLQNTPIAAAPAPTSATETSSGRRGVVSGADLLNSYQPMAVPQLFANGGKIKGPGGPTSDSIPAQVTQTGAPIRVSNNERIVSVEQEALLLKIAKARGFKTVDEMLQAGTGKPVGPTIKGGKMAAEQGKRPAVYADNFLNDAVNSVKRNLAQKGSDVQVLPNGKPNLTAEPPAHQAKPVQAPVAPAPVAASVPAPAPVVAPASAPAPTSAPALLAAASPLVKPAPPMATGTGQVDADGYLPGEGPLQKAGRRILDTLKSVPEAVKFGHFGNQAPASLAVGAPTASTPESSAPSAIEKTYADPSRKLDVNSGAGSAPAPTAPNPGANDPASNASILARNPGGAITKSVQPNGVTSYSGANVTGDTSFVDASGKPLSGRPGGGFMMVQGASKAEIDRTLTNPDGSRWSAGDNAVMLANIRDGIDPYRGTSRDSRNDPMNRPMSRHKRSAMLQDRRQADANNIAQGQLDLNTQEHMFKQTSEQQKQISEQQKQKLLEVYQKAKPGSPEQAQAEAAYRLLTGHNGNQPTSRYTVVPEFDEAGIRTGTTVLEDGKPIDLKGSKPAGGVTPTTQAEYDKLPKGAQYIKADGKPYIKG